MVFRGLCGSLVQNGMTACAARTFANFSAKGGTMFPDFAAAAAFVREHGIRMIDLKFSDLWGRWHHVTISATEFTPELMDDGVGFDGSSVGLRSVKSGDMVLIPDLATGILDPFWDVPTLSFICTTFEADSKRLFFRDPRNIALRAEAYMQGDRDRRREPLGAGVRVLRLRQGVLRERRQPRQLPRGSARGRLAQRRGRPRPLHPAARRLPRHPAQGPALQPAQPRCR